MKNVLLIIGLLLPISVFAQQGSIKYDRAVKFEFDLPPQFESMRDQIPTESVSSVVVLFDQAESLMKDVVEETVEGPEDGRARMMRGMMTRMAMGSGPASGTILQTYVNSDEGVIIESREFMGRTFLVTDEQPGYAWKLSGELSSFLGFTVEKATAVKDSMLIQAWYSPQIPASTGPESYSGLPGAILVLSIDNDRIVYSATEVSMDVLEPGTIVSPTTGSVVTSDEYAKIVADKIKEMESMRRGRGDRAPIRGHGGF